MNQAKTTFLKDYQAPLYKINTVDLTFELEPEATVVKSNLTIQAIAGTEPGAALELHGEALELISIVLDGQILTKEQYSLSDSGLSIKNPPQQFTLNIVNRINPAANSELSGLYLSSNNFCTQCEPHGFRRITYFIDRPDNLSFFTTTLIADKAHYPVMLSNGNRIAEGTMDDGRTWVKWEDPFLKPSYLFALVAGKLDLLEDTFITRSGREITLHLYVDPGELDKADHAMQSLKKAMRWDEKTYGREYDLDIFMTVAVRDFNMGAMENKGLNIFNSKYILANPKTATDVDFEDVLRVVGHEYFHNWSGNRVTCRDWFQLSLKEGLTVFRDQTFTADHTSEAIKRIDDVNILRTYQFAEDAGPMAHPVQPKSYIEINNFYTVTIYNKGAEVIRMMRTLLGKESFRKGTDLYFERHDGQAVTIEDFAKAMEDASGMDLTQFKRWYHQAGTPELTVSDHYDTNKKRYVLTVAQETSATPDQKDKQPFHIPLAVVLYNQQGEEVLSEQILHVKQSQQDFVFENIVEKPIPSLLRGFSAPVKLYYDYSHAALALLMAHDSDTFSRWQAGQQLALNQIKQMVENNNSDVDDLYIKALQKVVSGKFSDKALQALLLNLPSEKYIIETSENVDTDAIHQARESLRKTIAMQLGDELKQLYQENLLAGDYQNNEVDNGQRRIVGVCLSYMSLLDNGEQAWQHYIKANNMTDMMAALSALNNIDSPYRQRALDNFYQQWKNDLLVMDKWLSLQATSTLANTLNTVITLMQGDVFDIKNPNSVRALIGAFAASNMFNFHKSDGSGYQFLAEQIIILDKFNCQIAARLVTPLLNWRKFNEPRQKLLKQALEKIAAVEGLSNNTYELVNKALK